MEDALKVADGREGREEELGGWALDDIMPFGGGLYEGRVVEKLDHSWRRVQENPHTTLFLSKSMLATCSFLHQAASL